MKAMARRTWRKGEPLVELELPTPEPKRGELVVGGRSTSTENRTIED